MSFTIRKWDPLLARAAVLVLVALMSGRTSFAYSVLTHEEIVDLAWTPEIRPLLLHRLPGFGTRALSALLQYIPKVGPFKGLGFNNPTPQTEDLYIKSINSTVDSYLALLEQVRTSKLVLPNCDLDDGIPTGAAEYTLADETYANLLAKLSASKFDGTTPQLRANILAFYSDLSLPIETRKDPARWQGVLTDLGELQAAAPLPGRAEAR